MVAILDFGSARFKLFLIYKSPRCFLPSLESTGVLFGSEEEAKNRFSRCQPWRPSWLSNRNKFSYLWSTSHSDASYQVSSQLALGFRSRLLKQLLTQHNAQRMMDDGHWLTTIAHHEHFLLRWANKGQSENIWTFHAPVFTHIIHEWKLHFTAYKLVSLLLMRSVCIHKLLSI